MLKYCFFCRIRITPLKAMLQCGVYASKFLPKLKVEKDSVVDFTYKLFGQFQEDFTDTAMSAS